MSASVAHRRRGSGTALEALRKLRPMSIATAVVIGVQVPALLTLAVLLPHWAGLLAVGTAVALSHALLTAAHSPYSLQPRSAAHLYLGIYPALVLCGTGTTGPPLRIGARAELSLFTLRRAK